MTNKTESDKPGSCCTDSEQAEHLIAEGEIQEFDAAQSEIKFEGVLTNKGTIIIRSSNPAQTEAFLRATRIINEGKILSEVPTLKIFAEDVFGPGEVTALESIDIHSDRRLEINGGTFRSNWFRPTTNGRLVVHARRIDAQVDLAALEVSFGVREGNVNIVKQKLDGDPLYYNTGGDFTMAIPPSNGFDIYILAAGNVTVGSLDATGGANDGEVGNIVISTGHHFKNPSAGDNGPFQCGTFGCPFDIQQLSLPGGPLETLPGPFPLSGTITISGAKGKVISLTARDIIVNGNVQALKDNRAPAPAITFFASNSITVNGTITTDPNTVEPGYAIVALEAPTVTVSGKITADAVSVNSYANDERATGSMQTAAIESRTYISMNGGHIIFEEVGGGLLPALLPHDSGEFTIKTGKLTAHSTVVLAATGNIDAGIIELLPNEAQVQVNAHDVRIHANVGKENGSPLKIGGGTNGAASIAVHGTTDVGQAQKQGAIFLTNGPNGDIVLDGAKIFITNEHDGTPSLIAYAGTGQVTVKGDIKFDGTSSAPAGQILLVGDEIKSTGATLSVKDTLAAAAEKPAKVLLATSKVTLSGDLTVEANTKADTSITAVPKGSITLDPQEHITVYVDKFPVGVTGEQILVAGAGNLLLKTKGERATVAITGKPLQFNNSGTADLVAEGTDSLVSIDYEGEPTGQNSLVLNGGTVSIKASNPDGNAGAIQIRADKISSTAMASLSADALSQGNGGQITVNLSKGNISLGNAFGAFSMTAAARQSGNGGSISITNAESTGSITLDSSFAAGILDVAALGANGNGGTITLDAGRLLNNASADASALRADGVGSGQGGNITIKMKKDVKVTALPGIKLSARPNGTGNGGEINVQSNENVTLESDSVSVNGDVVTATSNGGRITVKAGEILTARGQYNASGNGAGNGGLIDFLAKEIRLRQQPQLLANGGASGGAGGNISLFASGSTAPLAIETADIFARGGTTGGVGGTISLQANSSINISRNCNFTADTPESGLADASGSIRIQANTGEITIDAGSNIKGGAVNFSSVGFSNQGLIGGTPVTFEAQDSNATLAFELNNTGTIESRKPKNLQRGNLILQTQRGILRFLGDGIFKGKNVSCDVARDIHFAGSPRFYVDPSPGNPNGYGLELLSRNAGAISIDSGDVVSIRNLAGNQANGLRCRIVAGLLTNNGQLESLDRIRMEGGHFVIDGTGELVTQVVDLVGQVIGSGSTGSVLVRQRRFRNPVTGNSILVASNGAGALNVVLEEGDLSLGPLLALGDSSDVLVQVQSGQLFSVVSGDPIVIRAENGSVTLKADSGSHTLGPDLSILAANSIYILLNGTDEIAGTPNPSVLVAGAGTVFWGPQGVVAPGSITNQISVSAGHKVVFYDNSSGSITLNGLSLTT